MTTRNSRHDTYTENNEDKSVKPSDSVAVVQQMGLDLSILEPKVRVSNVDLLSGSFLIPRTSFQPQPGSPAFSQDGIHIENQVPTCQLQSPETAVKENEEPDTKQKISINRLQSFSKLDPHSTAHFPQTAHPTQRQTFFTSRGNKTQAGRSLKKLNKLNRLALQEVRPAQMYYPQYPEIKKTAQQELSFELASPGRSKPSISPRYYQTGKINQEIAKKTQGGSELDMLLQAARRRRVQDHIAAKIMKVSSTETRREESGEDDDEVQSLGMAKSCEGLNKPKGPSMMNHSFGSKMAIQEFSPKKPNEPGEEGELYQAYLNEGTGSSPAEQPNAQPKNTTSILRNNTSLNQKVKALLESCSKTNIVLKDNSLQRSLFQSTLHRNVKTPVGFENPFAKSFKQPLLSKKAK